MGLPEEIPGLFHTGSVGIIMSGWLGAANYGVITPGNIFDGLEKIKKAEEVKAVILDINSNGGSPVAADRIYEIIENFKRETSIPVVAMLGEMAASGCYMIAANSDWIVANPATITGSIRVLLETYNLEGLYEKLGIYNTTFKQGEYKDILSESREITDDEKERILVSMDWYNQTFQEHPIRDRRGKIVDIATALEALLDSPRENITGALRSAVQALIGESRELSNGVARFNDMRSTIIHQGKADSILYKHPESVNEHLVLLISARMVFLWCIQTMMGEKRGSHVPNSYNNSSLVYQ